MAGGSERDGWLGRGTRSALAAGLPALLIALVAAAGDLLPQNAITAGLVIVYAVLRYVLGFALIRLVAANRVPTPPPPPIVDADGRRILRASLVPVLGEDDVVPRVALRRAGGLGWPALRLVAVDLLVATGVLLAVIAGVRGSTDIEGEPFALVAATSALSALAHAFLLVAPLRVALEGDGRVLLALAHAVRVARAHFAECYAIALLVALPTVIAATFPDGALGLGLHVARIAVVAVLDVLTTGWLIEVYLRGPRLDVPAEAVTRR